MWGGWGNVSERVSEGQSGMMLLNEAASFWHKKEQKCCLVCRKPLTLSLMCCSDPEPNYPWYHCPPAAGWWGFYLKYLEGSFEKKFLWDHWETGYHTLNNCVRWGITDPGICQSNWRQLKTSDSEVWAPTNIISTLVVPTGPSLYKSSTSHRSEFVFWYFGLAV